MVVRFNRTKKLSNRKASAYHLISYAIALKKSGLDRILLRLSSIRSRSPTNLVYVDSARVVRA